VKGRNQLLRQREPKGRSRQQQAGEQSQQQDTGGRDQRFKRMFHYLLIVS